jgi:hypothetical protein
VQRRWSTAATSRTEGSDDEAEHKAIVEAIEACKSGGRWAETRTCREDRNLRVSTQALMPVTW